jgi:hypothetical protein
MWALFFFCAGGMTIWQIDIGTGHLPEIVQILCIEELKFGVDACDWISELTSES